MNVKDMAQRVVQALANTKASRTLVKKPAEVLKRPASDMTMDDEEPPMPELTKQKPIYYLDCKIYTALSSSSWRVMRPDMGKNDAAFKWTNEPSKQWQRVLRFCKTGNRG